MSDLADAKVKESKGTIKKLTTALESSYEKLEEYVQYTNQLAATASTKEQLLAEKKKLEEMSSVIRKHKIKDEQNTSHTLLPQQIDDISKLLDKLENDLASKATAVEQVKGSMASQLEVKIQENRD